MKKCLFAGIFILLSCTTLFAQHNKGDITIAPQVGLNLSTYFSSDVSYDARTSAAGGIATDFYFNDSWSLHTGLFYNTMGAEDSFGYTDKLDYISLPVHANWHFSRNRNWYLNFGPTFSYLISGNSETNEGIEMDIKDAVSSFDVGLGVGIGHIFQINDQMQLFIDYQGYGGFLDVAEDNVLPYSIRNSSSSFNVGLVLDLN